MIEHLNISRLLDSADESELGWTLCFVGDSQQTKLVELINDLKNDNVSETGDGKKISSGFSYWGIGPTIKWADTCADKFYPVMQQSIDSFKTRWKKIYSKNIQNKQFHYVSLGVGTGEKDFQILTSLLSDKANLLYFPVDMSSTMLRMAIQKVIKVPGLSGSQVFPVQIDFSDENRVENLKSLLDNVVPDNPILFSLLGNTLANFQQDSKLLKILYKLMRPDDLLLLEMATTRNLENQTVQDAKIEYANIESFKKFVASALLQNTDLHLDLKDVLFITSVEVDKSILIKIVYKNSTNETIQAMLPDWSPIYLKANDTIRLYLTRKYISTGIDQMIMGSGLSIVDRNTIDFKDKNSNFGIDLLLLSPRLPNKENISSSTELKEGNNIFINAGRDIVGLNLGNISGDVINANIQLSPMPKIEW